VREVCLGAYAHQDVPFEKVVEELEPQRDLSRSPLFQVMFVLQHAPREQQALTGVKVSPLGGESSTSKFDLTLFVIQTGQGLSCALEYNTDLFEPEAITRLLGHWQMVLEGVVSNPQVHLSTVPLLTAAERVLLLEKWNATQREYPQTRCVHELFEQQVARTPDAVALVFEDEMLSYGLLNGRANRLAHDLQMLGVGPEVQVGICLERSLEMIMALLGVLKAGGAYVPLDPAYPQERLSYMIQDSHLQVVLTQTSLLDTLPSAVSKTLCLDTPDGIPEEATASNPAVPILPDHLAYIIYTSGSTGLPKGIAMPHRALLNLLHWQNAHSSPPQKVRTLQFTSLSFDVAFQELFSTWSVGGMLHLVTEFQRQDLADLTRLLHEQKIERLFLPCVALQQLAQEMEQSKFLPLGLREVITAGEQLRITASLHQIFCALPSCSLQNQYGPAETHVVTAHPLEADANHWPAYPPIGRPIANTQVYLLNEYLQPVPIGVSGEIALAGLSLARGYFHKPDLTAQRFLPNPFGPAGSRLYKTGDLARYRSDGTIEYLGRLDHQVKVRGYRIEPGEIEAVLRTHPAVQEAVVLAREDVAGEKRLVAYVVGLQEVTVAGLRSFLQEKLPAYMIPSQFLLVDAMPLTPNGKLDRLALPAPQQWHVEAEEGQQGARTGIEEVLVKLWSKVLGCAQVGIHDTFFELGGHSLLATQLLARVRAMLGVELPVRAVFETPTVAAFARRVEQALRKGEGIQMPPLVATASPEVLPLSFAQQRLWFLDQLEPGSPAYLIPGALCVDGEIKVQALERSFQELIHRHESLRTTFEERDGQPVQVIHPAGPFTLPVIDLQGLAEEVREQQARWLASQERQHPCDLTTGPLLRTSLLRLGSQEHVWLLTLHHIITDGWSNGILVCELTTLYQAKLRGQPSPLAPLPIQYADYALWQREWLQGEVLQASLSYWRSELTGIAPLELPIDHPRPPVQTYRGASQGLQLSPILSEQLVALSEQQNVTLFMLLLATFQVLLARYTGQRDISVGTPIANRRHAEIEGVIGLFVNMLVLRTDFTDDPTFDLVLQRVREVCLGAYAHQDLPFEKVVEELVPERDLSRSPLFQVMLVLQNAPQARADLAGVRVEPWDVETITSKFDLTLSIIQTDQGLSCALEYNRDLFEPETIIRMLSHWQTVLAGVVHNPQVRLSAVPLLTEAERVLMLEKWNATQREYPQELCVHELFEQQVERTPDAVALVFEEQQLTYGQLNRRANQLTHHLQMLGVGPEVLVGICMDRSIEMVMAMLGVLKAGGAYVPLDPTYPQERLAFLVTDSGVQVVLIHSLLKPEWLLSHKLQILELGRQREAMSAHRQENWQGSVVSENVAYVIYTSGSTGKPKGTMVRHRNVVNFLTGMDERLGSQVSGSWLAVTSICFDISVLELLWTLTRGLQVVIHAQESERLPSPGKMASQETMLQEIQRQGITHLQCTPSQASLLFAEPDQLSALASLRTLLLGGEALPMALVKQLETVLVGDLYNMYGPTETTIWSTMQRVEKGATTVSIGRPIVNTRVYILDQHWQVVPIGGAGELFLGGKGVVRGYWNHPELTAESFLPDPWSQEAGAVMYRTGDRARYLPDGSIEFLGRMDQQVKLRGYRIELGEIEAVLCSHPGVREGVVQVREDVPGDKRLVAYVVGSQDLTEARLRSFLQEQLPAYMLPSQFLLLDAMPLTPNGKLDRLALPAPQQWHGQAQEGQQGARTGIEELLVDLWSQVLGHSQVGIHDSFFELGGHSLLATQLIARVREMLEVEISLRAVFEAPTVARFALHVEQELRKSKGLLIPPLVARTRSKEIPLSFAQQRLWFLDQLESGSTAYLLPNVLHFLGSLNTRAFERSLEELLHRHEILRTTFVAHADQPVQVIHPAKRYCLPVIDLQGVREHEKTRLVEQLAEQEVRRPCDLAEGPLLRVYMFRLQLQDHRVFITLHHIITDGWSNGVLVRELSTLYQAFIMEQCSPLEPLPLQYADYTLWQQQWLQGEILTSLLNYWTKQLRGASPLKLPTDRPRTARVSNHGAIHTFKLPSSLYQSLVALSHQENVTLFMTLLAAFQILLHRYTGMQDIVVGTDVANRTSTETEKIIGFFVNLLVLRVQLSDQETFRELLKSVRTTVLNAYAHQDLPFEKLIDSLQLGRDGKQVPLVNVLFVLQNMTQQAFELPGLTVSSIGTQAHTAKFDIAMFLTEEAQELIGYVNYRTDLFQPDSIARLVHHFKVLLQSIVTSPDVIIDMLEMVTEEEKQQKSVLESTSHEKRIKKLKSAKRIKLRLSPED
jgi:amino acid adenylation domain-containing protein